MAIKHIKAKMNLSIRGQVETFQRRKGGEWKKVDKGNNIVTNNGLKTILEMLINGANRPNYIEVGLGTTPVDITDTVMETPIVGIPMTINTETRFVDNGRGVISDAYHVVFAQENRTEVTIQRENLASVWDNLNKNTLSEIGLFNRYALTNLIAHRLFDTPVDVDFESEENFIWTLFICRGDALSDDGFIVDGGLEILGDLFDANNYLYLRYPHMPRGLNYGVVGRNGGSSAIDTVGVINEVLRNKLVNFCIEEVDTIVDPTYQVKAVVQQMIPAFSFTGTIEEAGLYRVRKLYNFEGDDWNGHIESIPFCRAVFDPVDATDDICLTWEITLTNEPIV